MPVRETSLLAYRDILRRLPRACRPVFVAIIDKGPVHDGGILDYLRAKEVATFKPKRARRRWEISSVTGRRNDLLNKFGVIVDLGRFTGAGQSRPVHLYRIKGSSQKVDTRRWKPAEVDIEKQRGPQQRHIMHKRAERVRDAISKPILKRLQEFERDGRRKVTRPTGQLLLCEIS